MIKLDYFGLKKAPDLFAEVKVALKEYSCEPTDRLFFFLVFSLNHLREWIVGSSYKEVDKKLKLGYSFNSKELFYLDMWKLSEFRIINSLCNRGKHYLSRQKGHTTSIQNGAAVGVSIVGDSINQNYYLVDGVDTRNIFSVVVKKYSQWFNDDYVSNKKNSLDYKK